MYPDTKRKRGTAKRPQKKMEKVPKGVVNEIKNGSEVTNPRHRLVIMTLNVDSLISNKETLEMFLNDRNVHVMVVTETNVTESRMEQAKIAHYTIANSSCREDLIVKGGGGGGVIIYVHDSVPYIAGTDQITSVKGEIEFCSTTLFPNHSFDQPLVVVGIYRPPDTKHPEYGKTLEMILRHHKEGNKTTIIAGDLSINSWGREYQKWIEKEELWT